MCGVYILAHTYSVCMGDYQCIFVQNFRSLVIFTTTQLPSSWVVHERHDFLALFSYQTELVHFHVAN